MADGGRPKGQGGRPLGDPVLTGPPRAWAAAAPQDMYLARRAMLLGEQPLAESLALAMGRSPVSAWCVCVCGGGVVCGAVHAAQAGWCKRSTCLRHGAPTERGCVLHGRPSLCAPLPQSAQSFQDSAAPRLSPGPKSYSGEADAVQLTAGRHAARPSRCLPCSACRARSRTAPWLCPVTAAPQRRMMAQHSLVLTPCHCATPCPPQARVPRRAAPNRIRLLPGLPLHRRLCAARRPGGASAPLPGRRRRRLPAPTPPLPGRGGPGRQGRGPLQRSRPAHTHRARAPGSPHTLARRRGRRQRQPPRRRQAAGRRRRHRRQAAVAPRQHDCAHGAHSEEAQEQGPRRRLAHLTGGGGGGSGPGGGGRGWRRRQHARG